MKVSPARRAAFEILRRVEAHRGYSSALLAAADVKLDERDRGLCHELVLGVLRWRLWLDKSIEHFAARQVASFDLPVTLALRLGLYQLRFLTRIPASAAVDESVKLVRAARLSSAAGFVNAVLRRAIREGDYDPTAGVDDASERLAIEMSHPGWLIERWIGQFGFDEARDLARANNQPAPLAFRLTARTLSEREDKPTADMLSACANIRQSDIAPTAWRVITGTADIKRLADRGLIYFQDEASQLVAHLTDVRGSQRVLDVCAAPGSKSTLIATVALTATIVAGDLYEARAKLIGDIATKQSAQNVYPIVHDATKLLPFAAGTFDCVLVDAPCSGTGTLRQNPEIRWRLRPADVQELAAKQRMILDNASTTVRQGGRLVYSTCSVEIDENEKVIEAFMREHPEFEKIPLKASRILLTDTGSARTWPHRHDVDGFFIAAFRRTALGK